MPYLKYTLYDPLKDRVFRHFVGYAFTITLSAAISGIFYWRFCLVTLGYSLLATNMLFLVIGPLADMTSAPIWGRLIDRFGRRPVLLIATCGLSLSVLPWLIAQRGTPHPLFVEQAINFVCGQICSLFGQSWAGLDPSLPVGAYMLTTLGCIIGGTAWSGVNLAQMGLMLGIADSSGRSRAVAASGVLISIGGVVGGYCGGLLTQYIGEQTVLDWGPLLWVNFQATMVVTAALRVLAVGWLIGMPDPGAMPVRAVLVSLKGNFFNVLYSVAFQPLRILGLSRPAEFDRCGEKHGQNQKPPEQVDSSRDRGQDKG